MEVGVTAHLLLMQAVALSLGQVAVAVGLGLPVQLPLVTAEGLTVATQPSRGLPKATLQTVEVLVVQVLIALATTPNMAAVAVEQVVTVRM